MKYVKRAGADGKPRPLKAKRSADGQEAEFEFEYPQIDGGFAEMAAFFKGEESAQDWVNVRLRAEATREGRNTVQNGSTEVEMAALVQSAQQATRTYNPLTSGRGPSVKAKAEILDSLVAAVLQAQSSGQELDTDALLKQELERFGV